MAIHIVRHGETELNVARVVQKPDTPLSVCGCEQARRVGRRFVGGSIALILTSDYLRAKQTAESIKVAIGAPLEVNTNLRERNFGDLRGTSYDSRGNDIFAEDYVPQNGESWAKFHKRVDKAWAEVVAVGSRLRGDLVVVTHGLVCLSLLDRVLAVPANERVDGWVVGNTSVTVVDAVPPHTVDVLACVTHLEGMD